MVKKKGEFRRSTYNSCNSVIAFSSRLLRINFLFSILSSSFLYNTIRAMFNCTSRSSYISRIGKARILDESIDFGLISPYKAQVQYLRSKIRGSSFLRPFRSLITVNTVDGFQGQERDVIFISLVRANEDGQIGFLNDLRRMNVAITRARMKLVILGDASTLTKHPFYKRLMLFIKKED